MKFNIKTHGHAIDLCVIEQALIKADPAAMIDLHKSTALLRVSSGLDDSQLLSLITDAGFPIAATNFEGVPSDCCGGCGG